MNTKTNNKLYVALFFAMFAWGASWVNIKFLGFYINEFEVVFLRFCITALTLIPIILYLKESFKIDPRSLFIAFVTSLFFLAYMKYFFLGTKLGTASLGGAFVTSLAPVNTFLLLALFRLKSIQKKDYFALFLGALGVMSMLNVWNLQLNSILTSYNLYFLLASILWPLVTIISSFSTKLSPLVFSFYMYIFTCILSGAFFVDFGSFDFENFDATFYINLFSISILASTYSNSVYFIGIRQLGAEKVSSFIFLVPFFAIILSIIFLGESISLSITIGTFMTLYAVKIINNIKFKGIKW